MELRLTNPTSSKPCLHIAFRSLKELETFDHQIWSFGVVFVQPPSPLRIGQDLELVLESEMLKVPARLPAQAAYLTDEGQTALRVDLANTTVRQALRHFRERAFKDSGPPNSSVDLMALVREAQTRKPSQPSQSARPKRPLRAHKPTPIPTQPQSRPLRQPQNTPIRTVSTGVNVYMQISLTPPRLSLGVSNPISFKAMMASFEEHKVAVIRLDPKPQLNTVIDVDIVFIGTSKSGTFKARVVRHAPTGTVLDFSELGAHSQAELLALINATPIPSAPNIPSVPSPGHRPQHPVSLNTLRSVVDGQTPQPAQRPQPTAHASTPSIPVVGQEPVSPEARAQALNALLDASNPSVDTSFRNNPIAELLHISALCKDGVAVIDGERVRYLILFQLGAPQDIYTWPTIEPSTLGHLLTEAQKLSAHEHTQACTYMKSAHIPYAEALVACRLMSHQEVSKAQTARLKHLLLKVFGVHQGHVRFSSVQRSPYRMMLNPTNLPKVAYQHLCKVVKASSVEEVQRFETKYKAITPVLVNPSPFEIGDLDMSEQHDTIYHALSGKNVPYAQLSRQTKLNPQIVSETLMVFVRLGLIEFEQRAAHPQHTLAMQKMIAALSAKRQSLEKTTNPFDVFGEHWSSYDGAIERAYQKNINAHTLSRYPAPIHENIRNDINLIRACVDKARTQLDTLEKRKAIRQRLIKTEEINSIFNQYMKQIEMHRWRSEWDQAKDACFRALELKPSNRQAQRFLKKIEAEASA